MTLPEKATKDPKIGKLEAKFMRQAALLMDPSNEESKKIMNYLQRVGFQVGVCDFSPQEIVVEAVIAGIDSINRNRKEIRNVSAWVKRVGINRINNRVREEIRDRKLISKQAYHDCSADSWLKLLISEQRDFIGKAMSVLSDDEQELVHLKHVEGLSYKDIKTQLLETKSKSISEAALRKRDSRALKKLKAEFEATYT